MENLENQELIPESDAPEVSQPEAPSADPQQPSEAPVSTETEACVPASAEEAIPVEEPEPVAQEAVWEPQPSAYELVDNIPPIPEAPAQPRRKGGFGKLILACTIIAGSGSNATSHAVALSAAAEQAGADAQAVNSYCP